MHQFPYSDRCGEEPHPKKWKIKSYKKAIVIECNIAAFDDSLHLIREYMKAKPQAGNIDNGLPKLVINKDIRTGLQLYETVDAVSDYELGDLEDQFNVNAVIGFVELCEFYFLVVVVNSCCVASLPITYPVYGTSGSISVTSAEFINPKRHESLIYRIDRVVLIPVHLPSKLWGLSISNDDELVPTQVLTDLMVDGGNIGLGKGQFGGTYMEDELTYLLGEKVMKNRAGVSKFLNKHHYYSYDIDLSKTAQKFSISISGFYSPQSQHIPMIKRWMLGSKPSGREERHFEQRFTGPCLIDVVDKRFCWNYQMVQSVMSSRNIDGRWFVPVIQGNVSSSITILRKDELESRIQLSPDKRLPGDKRTDKPSESRPYAIEIYLIGRREWYRGGTRYNHRGLDKHGNVANFVESEMTVCISRACGPNFTPAARMPTKQLIEYMKTSGDEFKLETPGMGWASFVQIRGSVPLFWMQNIKKNPAAPPPVLLDSLSATHPKYMIHMEGLIKTYGAIYCINLLSLTRGNEDRLTKAWLSQNKLYGTNNEFSIYGHHKTQKNTPSLVSWDFHKELKNMSFNDALTQFWLTDEAQSAVMRCGYFVERPLWAHKSIHQFQTGVIRTNCLDCLDRTNAMQYWFAWNWFRCYVSDRGFHAFTAEDRGYKSTAGDKRNSVNSFYIGGLDDDISSNYYILIDPKETMLPSDSLLNPAREIVSSMWADHGDRISQIYTGTGSVITELLKEGRHTFGTRMNHAFKSINRLYYNAYEDHNRQEAIDNIIKAFPVDLPMHNVAPPPIELNQLLHDLEND